MKLCPHTGPGTPAQSTSATGPLMPKARHSAWPMLMAAWLAFPMAALGEDAASILPPTATATAEQQPHESPTDEPPHHNHSQVDPGLNLFGFLTANYDQLGSAAAGENLGKAGKLEGALLATYGHGPFRFLTEAVVGADHAEVERFQFGLQLRPGTVIWVGRVHQPSSYWNTEFHHGQYLQNSITRPAIENWEDEGGVLTQHVGGILLETERSLANGTTVRLATSAGYAPAIESGTLEPFDVIHWHNGVRHPAFALRIDVLPDGIGEQAFGLMSGFSGLQARGSGIESLDHVDLTTIGLYGDVRVGEARWLGSVYRIRTRFDYGQHLDAEYATSWFLHGEYRLREDWMGYLRHESTLGTDDSRYFATFPDFVNGRSVVGLRYESGSNHALSLETGSATSNGERYMELRLQWSAVFH